MTSHSKMTGMTDKQDWCVLKNSTDHYHRHKRGVWCKKRYI